MTTEQYSIGYEDGYQDGWNESQDAQNPQRTWVGLTDEEKKSFWTADQMTQEEWDELFSAIEAKLKEKNT
jgi:hypothetical protein